MVRQFVPQDSERVRELVISILTSEYPFDKNAYADSDINNIAETYAGNKNAFFVFEEKKTLSGTVGVKCDSEKTALLRRFFVRPEARGKGVGSSLLSQAIDFCKKNKYHEIVFRATDRMKNAMRLIEKHGFKKEETLEIAGFHIHVFKKKL